MNVIIDDFYHSENITVIIKRASVATYCYACRRSVPHTLSGLLLPRPLPIPSPLPMGVCLGFLYTSGCCCQAEAISEAAGERPYTTACDVEERTSHSPAELRCGVGMSSWTHAWGLKESSWNKSCVYKGQLELQWQWRVGILRFQGLVTTGLGLQPLLKSYSLPTSVSDLASW